MNWIVNMISIAIGYYVYDYDESEWFGFYSPTHSNHFFSSVGDLFWWSIRVSWTGSVLIRIGITDRSKVVSKFVSDSLLDWTDAVVPWTSIRCNILLMSDDIDCSKSKCKIFITYFYKNFCQNEPVPHCFVPFVIMSANRMPFCSALDLLAHY